MHVKQTIEMEKVVNRLFKIGFCFVVGSFGVYFAISGWSDGSAASGVLEYVLPVLQLVAGVFFLFLGFRFLRHTNSSSR